MLWSWTCFEIVTCDYLSESQHLYNITFCLIATGHVCLMSKIFCWKLNFKTSLILGQHSKGVGAGDGKRMGGVGGGKPTINTWLM